jgi:[protein-PII] uridylyltransferase
MARPMLLYNQEINPQQSIRGNMNKSVHINDIQTKRMEIIDQFHQGNVFDFELKYARLIDTYFQNMYANSLVGKELIAKKHHFAILALGGYGRNEQCVYSDIDLLLLFKSIVPDETKQLIKEIIYPLWDIGLEVSPGTRTIKETIALASDDIEVLTAHMDARQICGSTSLYANFRKQLQEKVIHKKKSKMLISLIDISKYRHERFGDSSSLLEPNIKEGQGGLRDYHSMLWMARLLKGLKVPKDLEYLGCISQNEYSRLRHSLAFLWKIRNHLHILSARKNDQLHFELQTQLSSRLNYKENNELKPVELFLSELQGHMETIKKLHMIMIRELKPAKRRFNFKRKILFTPLEKNIYVERELLFFKSPESIIQRPELMMKIFVESARLKLPLSAEAHRLIEDFCSLIDEKFVEKKSVIKDFERILITHTPMFNVLHEMLATGLLGKIIPEFNGIANRIQYDQYHVYPVDKHVLKTVQRLKSFGVNDSSHQCDLCSTLYRELKRKKRDLLWAALLHDIGKNDSQGDHSEKGEIIAKNILRRFGYGPRKSNQIALIIKEHLFLITMATRRDVDDEQTAIACARRIHTVEQLNMLYLLTVADSMSTGPNAWSDWVDQLLKKLYYSTLSTIENGELATEEAIQKIEKKKIGLLKKNEKNPDQQELIHTCFKFMSERYLLYSSVNEMDRHIKLYESLSNQSVVMHVEKEPETNTRVLTICAKDRPGLFSIITGILSICNISICAARVHTWRNRIALDIFKVIAPKDHLYEDQMWQKIENKIQESLSSDLLIHQELAEQAERVSWDKHLKYESAKIRIDNQMSAFYTIIEVFALDRPGLLFGITDTLYRSGYTIYFAKIATKHDQVVDIFYIKDLNGYKIQSNTQVQSLKQKISDIINAFMD